MRVLSLFRHLCVIYSEARSQQTKKEIMKLTTENKQHARLAQLMQSERDHLFRYACYRLGSATDADDAVQELYVKLSKQGARLAEIDDLKGYVYRSLSNSCTSLLRSRRQFATTETLDTLRSDDLAPTDFEQEFRLIELLMAHLPEEQSEVIRLRIYGGRTFDEIASICNIPLTTAKSRFRYGIDKLREALEKRGLI